MMTGELLGRFRDGPTLIGKALGGNSPSTELVDGEGWSVRDVLVHLADAELVRGLRIRLILAEDAPGLFGFDEGAWRKRLSYGRRDPGLALRSYGDTVAATCDLLTQAGDAAWGRVGIHPTDGQLTVRTLVERGIQHAIDHAGQLRGILRR